MFTCVAATSQGPKCFRVVCEDLCHDTPQQVLALKCIEAWLESYISVYASLTYGAPAHFKNRFQLYEFQRAGLPKVRWVFSASGHGKNTCDGVGGLLKHQAKEQNLRSPADEAIPTSMDFEHKVGKCVKT